MLQSFLNWYVLEIKISAESQGADVEKDEQIVILDDINNKVNALVQEAAEKLLKQTI
jgi:copper chaperone CopZ